MLSQLLTMVGFFFGGLFLCAVVAKLDESSHAQGEQCEPCADGDCAVCWRWSMPTRGCGCGCADEREAA